MVGRNQKSFQAKTMGTLGTLGTSQLDKGLHVPRRGKKVGTREFCSQLIDKRTSSWSPDAASLIRWFTHTAPIIVRGVVIQGKRIKDPAVYRAQLMERIQLGPTRDLDGSLIATLQEIRAALCDRTDVIYQLQSRASSDELRQVLMDRAPGSRVGTTAARILIERGEGLTHNELLRMVHGYLLSIMGAWSATGLGAMLGLHPDIAQVALEDLTRMGVLTSSASGLYSIRQEQ